MKVISHETEGLTEKFVVDIEGYKYYFTEVLNEQGLPVSYELLNEHGREVVDKTVVGVVQELINKHLSEE